ncbi:hypothetical protein PTNB73_08162 [Pyrenophora teres f. teres]|nr:hypothetical protein HRS9139_07788 [Pyrenophora teres f. teres]CAA9966292.1 hypothetical protein PTMSG1_09651 [Pyrenophora teres f. maculata]KAE8832133.1 hypothetical protein PTNB85_06525 [Pyrenophora teres f. teres]KAE8837259.1 hypothetical protein HRS9122_07414 [Pyrenophora teres f. teres]KAE8855794.1 hypothetical protein PTNB29_08633 [Pyrenophora teres f. teres]
MARKKNANRAQAPAPSPHAQSNNNTSDNAQAGSWFLKFPPFVYDPTAGLRSNFDRLAAQRNWGEKVRRRRWVECQEEEFGNAFGTDTTKLESWQKLCREVHISDPPESISGCKKVSSTLSRGWGLSFAGWNVVANGGYVRLVAWEPKGLG